eukprot:gnl/Chilomastix_cuspidata/1963.p1 GENE.gnl/Chilomastix_cuspidata/1963~~gnl/Chilomastix_cuspidata/1963.p1  ORF type:complete len:440 (-),score=157.21 gnl/Chilomastix_cuspidata/1963:886-2205(-)
MERRICVVGVVFVFLSTSRAVADECFSETTGFAVSYPNRESVPDYHLFFDDLLSAEGLDCATNKQTGRISVSPSGHLSSEGDDISNSLFYEIYFSSAFSNYTDPGLTPLVIVHGGPGSGHSALLTMKALACANFTVIFYDQVGCGNSTWASDPSAAAFEGLLDPAYYPRELDTVVQHVLGADPATPWHLLGHSWGSMVAEMYAIDAESFESSRQLGRVVLAGAIADLPAVQARILDEVVAPNLPAFYTQLLREDAETDVSFGDAVAAYYRLVFTPLDPSPFEMAFCDGWQNFALAEALLGPVYDWQQTPDGYPLAGWSVMDRLRDIDRPTLVVNGAFDEVPASHARELAAQLRDGTLRFIDAGTHLSHVDQLAAWTDAVREFLEADAPSGLSVWAWVTIGAACALMGAVTSFLVWKLLSHEKRAPPSCSPAVASTAQLV